MQPINRSARQENVEGHFELAAKLDSAEIHPAPGLLTSIVLTLVYALIACIDSPVH